MDMDVHLLRAIREAIPAAIMITSPAKQEFTYVNGRACTMFSYDPDDLIRLNPLKLLDTGESTDIWKRENDMRVVKFKTRSAHLIWGLMSSKRLIDGKGEAAGTFHSIFDITRRKKAEDLLKQSQFKMRHLSKKLIRAQEAERRRISVELHDGISSNIIAVRLMLENKLAEIGYEDEFADIIKTLKLISTDTRRISRNLHPSVLEDIGLVAALKTIISEFSRSKPDIEFLSRIRIDDIDIDAGIKLTLYRILQEALNNIIKHSRADRVEIVCESVDTRLELKISDNGCGFDVDSIFNVGEDLTTGLGIESMKERAEHYHGEFAIESTPGQGTQIFVRIPA